MNMVDLVGYLAASLVFIAFLMRGMTFLRVIALGSNVCFLAYAFSLHLVPIEALHLALIPVNCWRLWEHIRKRVRPFVF
jgi:CRP/FNR family cyclic AMP-dependent transcriptional regulator